MVEAIASGQADVRDVLAAVTPGGGKSLLPVIAAARMIAAGIVERVCDAALGDGLASTPGGIADALGIDHVARERAAALLH